MPTQSSSSIVARLAVAVSAAALSLSATAADITWENKTGDWTQDELWNGGVAPGSEDVASFKSGEMSITNAVQFGDEFHIGKGGTGVLTIEPTGAVTGGCYHVGRDGGTGTMIVNGGSVKATKPSDNWYGCFNIAWGSNSKGLVQLRSGTIEANHAAVGRSRSATGRLEISGGEFRALGEFNIGHDGIDNGAVSHGEVFMSGGRLLGSGGNINVAAGSSSSGEMSIQGGIVENSKELRIGGSANAVGRFTMTGGAWTNTTSSVNIGATGSAVGYMTINGGEFYSEKHIRVGNKGTGLLTIGGNGVVIDNTSNDDYMCFGGPDSVLRLNVGGKLFLRSILRDNNANGTVEFNGGEMIKTVEQGAYSWSTGSTAIDDHHAVKVLAGGMIFNSDYLSTYKGSILCTEGCGGITKRGAGELNLNTNGDRSFEFAGPIYVEGGTLRFSGNAQIPTFIDVIRVAEGATLVIPHDVTCRVLENNGRIQGGTVTVESDAAAKVATKAVWTGAMEDGDVYNVKNYIVYDQNDRVMYEQTITTDTPVVVPFMGAVPSFAGFSDVTGIVEDDFSLYIRPAVLDTAAVWYDPSDEANVLCEGNYVTGLKNKGAITANNDTGVDLDLELRNPSDNQKTTLSAAGFNGRRNSVYFNGGPGYRSKGYFPAELTANSPRTLFTVAQGSVEYMVMLSIAKKGSGDNEGRSMLIAHNNMSWSQSYQVGYWDGSKWEQGRRSFSNLQSDVPYVFAGRTSLPENGGVAISAFAIDQSGVNHAAGGSEKFGSLTAPGDSRYVAYYGAFEISDDPGFWVNRGSNGYQGEALIFTNALSDAEMDAVNAYLKGKWIDQFPAMPDSLVVNAQVDLDRATLTFEKLSGSGSFVDGTVVLTGDLVVTVNSDGTVVAPSFDKLVLGENARLVVKGARYLPTKGTVPVVKFSSIQGEFAAVVGDGGAKPKVAYTASTIEARRDSGMRVMLR